MAIIDLRELTEDDEATLYQWRLEAEVDRWMSDAAFPSPEAHREWFDRLRTDPGRRGWMIIRAGRPQGLLTLAGLDSHHRRGEWAFFIGAAEARGRGVGRATQVLGLDKAFGELGLHKVWAEVMADNDAALKAQTAAGFRREGYLRGHVLKDGQPRDVVIMGILAEEWRERREQARKALTDAHMIAA